jgi:hypothetical protein
VGNPGAPVSPAFAESFATGLKHCRVVQLPWGIQYSKEDQPDVIGAQLKSMAHRSVLSAVYLMAPRLPCPPTSIDRASLACHERVCGGRRISQLADLA